MSVLDDIYSFSKKSEEPQARAARKRAGLPVDNAPADNIVPVSEQQPQGFADIINMNHPYSDKNIKKKDEELKRKQKRDATMAALGDGLNAFHQAYAYSRGIKPLTENKSQSKDARDKYDALTKSFDENKISYLNAYMNGLKMDEARKTQEEERTYRRERDKAEDEYRKQKDEEAKEVRERKERQEQENWRERFEAEQKDKEERRNNQKEHYERQDRNAANRNANSGKKGSDKKTASSGNSGKGKSGASGFSIHNNEKDKTKSAKGGFSIHR